MARPYRLQGEGLLYHITSRGDDRKKIFVNEADYQKFLEYLLSAKEKFRFYLYAYCLMGNHYHLLLETTQPNLSKIMHNLNTAYTVYYNIKRKRCGHLFQGRYKSILVDKDEYLLELIRYIHLNPVRAKIVDEPRKYRWSGHLECIKEAKEGLIDKAEAQRYFKMSAGGYEEFVREGMVGQHNPFKKVHAGFVMGKEEFIRDTFKALKIQVVSGEYAYRRKITSLEPQVLIQAVANHYRKDEEFLRKAKNKPLLARKVAVYLLKRYSGLTNKEIGVEFGISYSAVSKIERDIERLMIEKKGLRSDIERIISHFKV